MTAPDWTVPPPAEVSGPSTGDDRPLLEAYLRWQRRELLNICAGLSADQLALRPVATSTLSLLGLLRHLAKVERIWLRQRAAGEAVPMPYDPERWRTSDFEDADPAEAAADVQRLHEEWAAADAAVAALPFDHTVDMHGDVMSLRMIYVHLIGEYARHNGHADLLREAIDGVTGR